MLWYRQFFNPLVNFAGKHFELTFALGVHLQGALASLFLSDLERSAFGGRNNQHTLVGIGLAHRLADVDAILVGDVVIFLKFFVLEELLPYLSVEGRKLLVKFFLFLAQIVNLLPHLDDFPLHFRVLPAADPLDGIFVQFFDIIDAFQDIGDVINSSLLYAQLLDGHVEVDSAVVGMFDELNKLLGEDGETIVLPAFA